MRLFVFAIAAALILSVQSSSPARAASQIRLLALSKGDHILAIVDPATLQIIARVPVGADPHEVVASANGRTAWVSEMGGLEPGQGYLHEIDVIDLVHGQRLAPVDTGPLSGPHGLAVAGGEVWFTAQGAKAIARLNPATSHIDLILGTGQDWTHMIEVTPDQKKIYATNVISGTVSLFDIAKPLQGYPLPPDWRQTLVPTGLGAEGFDVTPDGHELWTPAALGGRIFIVDLQKRALATSLDAHVEGANRLKITPDGRLALISSLGNGELTIYDVARRAEVKRIKLGRGAAGVLVSPDGARAFVANTPDNDIAVIDLKTFAVVGHIALAGPDGLAWASQP